MHVCRNIHKTNCDAFPLAKPLEKDQGLRLAMIFVNE